PHPGDLLGVVVSLVVWVMAPAAFDCCRAFASRWREGNSVEIEQRRERQRFTPKRALSNEGCTLTMAPARPISRSSHAAESVPLEDERHRIAYNTKST